MAGVFKEITLQWNGAEYRVTPTMRIINAIENDISLARLAHRMQSGDVPLSQLAVAIGHLLRAGGASVQDDEVYQEIMTGNAQAIQDLAAAVLGGVFPEPKKSDK